MMTELNPQALMIRNAIKFAERLRDNGNWTIVEVHYGVRVRYGSVHSNGFEECERGHAEFYADGTHRIFTKQG